MLSGSRPDSDSPSSVPSAKKRSKMIKLSTPPTGTLHIATPALLSLPKNDNPDPIQIP